MGDERDGRGLLILDAAACLARLARQHVACVAVTDRALPVVVPAVYHLDDHDIVVSAFRGGLLGRRLPDNIVSVCVHDIDDDFADGWSVTVTGMARPDPTPLPLDPVALGLWSQGVDPASLITVRIGTERMTGRQVTKQPNPGR